MTVTYLLVTRGRYTWDCAEVGGRPAPGGAEPARPHLRLPHSYGDLAGALGEGHGHTSANLVLGPFQHLPFLTISLQTQGRLSKLYPSVMMESSPHDIMTYLVSIVLRRCDAFKN